MGLNLAKALRLDPIPPPRVAFVGAGGKTTALFQLAKELAPCIVTTTTHLGAWQADLANQHIIIRKMEDVNLLEDITFSGVILVTGKRKEERLISLAREELTWLEQFCNYHSLPLLIEADGARQKSLKTPKRNEPVIPEFVDTVVVVAGLSGVGKLLNDENVYNTNLFAKLGKMKKGKTITADNLSKVLIHKNGGLKNIPAKAQKIALLNQANTPELQAIGEKIAKTILSEFDSAIVANLQTYNLEIFDSTAAIILAAGTSSRFGESKQLLDYHGKPFIRNVAEAALNADLSAIIVVTGAEHDEIESVLENLDVKNASSQDLGIETKLAPAPLGDRKGTPLHFKKILKIVHNPDWKKGQSSSIRAGVKALPEETGSAIFLLADQPQITSTVMHALVEKHQRTLNPIIAPMVEGKRANPVLFDRVTFPALLKLKGDIGGRNIFSKFPPSYIFWSDSSLLLDVDSPEDYEKLLKTHKNTDLFPKA